MNFLMDYISNSPLGACFALSLVIGLEETIGGPRGTSVLSCLAFSSEKSLLVYQTLRDYFLHMKKTSRGGAEGTTSSGELDP